MKNKLKCIHLVPTSYGGGVEAAASSFLKHSCDSFEFEVFFIKQKKDNNFIRAFIESFMKMKIIKPDFILTSLWKSNLLVLFFKLYKKNTKYILFLHSTENKHFIDGLITTLSAFFAYEIWADSEETLRDRIKSFYCLSFYKEFLINKNKNRVISFVLGKINPLKHLKPKNSFIYWGRLCPKKNIYRRI